MAAYDSTVGSERCSLLDQGFCIDTVYRKVSARSSYVGEHARRAAEDVVFDFNSLIYRHIILDTHSVAYPDIVADIHILAQRTVFSQRSALLDMAEMPYLGAVSYDYIIIDVARRVYEIFLLFHTAHLLQHFHLALVGKIFCYILCIEDRLGVLVHKLVVHIAV